MATTSRSGLGGAGARNGVTQRPPEFLRGRDSALAALFRHSRHPSTVTHTEVRYAVCYTTQRQVGRGFGGGRHADGGCSPWATRQRGVRRPVPAPKESVENAIVLRSLEAQFQLRPLVSSLKLRLVGRDPSLPELVIGTRGIEAADTCESAEAVLLRLARNNGTQWVNAGGEIREGNGPG